MKRKAVTAAALAAGMLLSQLTASASGAFTCISGNESVQAPAYSATQVFKSTADNPDEKTRFEGVPNLLWTGGAVGAFSYEKISDKNYCTKIVGANPFVYHATSTYTDGIYQMDMDLSMGENAVMVFQPHFINADGKTILLDLVNFNSNGDTSFPSFSSNYSSYLNSKNYAEFKRLTVAGDLALATSWVKVSVRVDMTSHTIDLYLNDLPVLEKLPIPADQNLNTLKGIRITKRGTGTAYLDNYNFMYYPTYNKDLLNQSILFKEGKTSAYVRRVPIKIERGSSNVTPYTKNEVTYLPLRFVADYFDYYGNLDTTRENFAAENFTPGVGTSVGYDAATGAISVTYEGKTWTMFIGSSAYTCDGETCTLTPPVAVDGRTMVSMEAIAKIFCMNAYSKDGNYLITKGYGVAEDDFDGLFENLEVE